MTVVLLDANNLAMRAFHAAKYSMTSDGAETGSLHIFMTSLSKLLHDLRPTHFVACWDGGASTFRTRLYPGYKSARRASTGPAGPAPHGAAFGLIQKFLQLANLPQWQIDGVEADDLIACATANELVPGAQVVILSSDKDLLQCLYNDRVQQWRFTSDGPEVWTRDTVLEKFGYPVEHITRVMALTGDTSDSIPGAKGIGPKKAVKLLEANGWEVHRVMAQRADAEMINTSYELVRLPAPGVAVPPVPIYEPLSMSSSEKRWQDMADFCSAFQLRKLWDDLTRGVLLAPGSLV